MPDFPLIDAHVHIVDPARLPYGWMAKLPDALRRGHSLTDLRAAIGDIAVERVVFVEFLVDAGRHLDETRYAEELIATDGLVAAIVAHAPVERGDGVLADLEALAACRHVRSVRRILEGQYDNGLSADFIEGVKLVGRFGLPFEIGVSPRGLRFGIELVHRCPETLFILDHLATPPIRGDLWQPWRSEIAELARAPNVVAKISGVLAEVDPARGSAEQVVPYLDYAIGAFGFDRVMFGSDWPMLTTIASYGAWLRIVETTVAGANEAEKRKLFRDNAARIYRL